MKTSLHHFALTGTLESLTRGDAIKRIEGAGFSYSQAVTKETTILVVGRDPGQKKLTGAAIHGTQTVTEAEFMGLVGVARTGNLPGL